MTERPSPTPEEIHAACLKIRASWTAREEARRACFNQGTKPWVVPIIPTLSMPSSAIGHTEDY
jgi:hypothetical protein